MSKLKYWISLLCLMIIATPAVASHDVAALGCISIREGVAPLKVVLDSSEIEDYIWNIPDGKIAHGEITPLLVIKPGTHIITSIAIITQSPRAPPITVSTLSPIEGVIPVMVTLNSRYSQKDNIDGDEWTTSNRRRITSAQQLTEIGV